MKRDNALGWSVYSDYDIWGEYIMKIASEKTKKEKNFT
jgi:hypothetical protein